MSHHIPFLFLLYVLVREIIIKKLILIIFFLSFDFLEKKKGNQGKKT